MKGSTWLLIAGGVAAGIVLIPRLTKPPVSQPPPQPGAGAGNPTLASIVGGAVGIAKAFGALGSPKPTTPSQAADAGSNSLVAGISSDLPSDVSQSFSLYGAGDTT